MNGKAKAVILAISLMLVGAGTSVFMRGQVILNPQLPNIYAPNYQASRNPDYFLKFVSKDRQDVFDQVVLLNANRPRPLNPFKLDMTNGEVLDSQNLGGQVTVIYLFSQTPDDEWTKGIEGMNATYQKYKDKGVKFYGAAVRTKWAAFDDLMQEGKIEFPVHFAVERPDVIHRFYPTTIFLDKNGKVRCYVARDITEHARDSVLNALLKETVQADGGNI